MARYAIQAASLNGTQLLGLTGASDALNRQIASEGTDGALHEVYHFGQRTAPTIDVSGVAIGSYLDLLTASSEAPMVALNGSTGLVLWAAPTTGSDVGYGATGLKTTALNGLLYLASLSWSAGGDAEASLRCLAWGATGETEPLVRASASLPAQGRNSERWVVDRVTWDGTEIDHVDSVEVSIDPMLEHDYQAGLPHPVGFVGAGARGPLQIRCRVSHGDLADASADGTAKVLTVRLRKRSTGASLVSASSEYILLSFNGFWATVDGDGRSHGSPIQRTLELLPYYDGTTRPLVWSHYVA